MAKKSKEEPKKGKLTGAFEPLERIVDAVAETVISGKTKKVRARKEPADATATAEPKTTSRRKVKTAADPAEPVVVSHEVESGPPPVETSDVMPPAPPERRDSIVWAGQAAPSAPVDSSPMITDGDVYLFNEGTHHRLFDKLGAHPITSNGTQATHFAVWAPNAQRVSVVGDFNGWNPGSNPLDVRGSSGIWEGIIDGVGVGTVYKYHIESRYHGYRVDKADPFGFMHEVPPRTASVVWELDYEWRDDQWLKTRAGRNSMTAPISIYEVHLGSWKRNVEEDRPLTYREVAEDLATYVKGMGFTHIELMPVMEHPFYGSWGYQVTGFFAPTSRFGTPQDLMYLIDVMHQHDIGVILDWVPSHFPTDEHGLSYFDGTHLYEHADPRQGFHPDWGSLIFNYGRNEVRSFLLSSGMFWLDVFHADGLRVDAVASMLYLDYSRNQGEWIPNKYGGRENLEAVSFLRRMNEDLYGSKPGIVTIAEESTAWPAVSRPLYLGGLGFGMKWDMGWMHDTLAYMQHDPVHRKFHHNTLTFRMMYAYTENFVLPLSHDEVVHGKGSLLNKMPGDDWQKFANLRLLFAYMFSQPGKKLLFMGGEIGQWREWNHDRSLDWDVLERHHHAGINRWVRELNAIYRGEPSMHAHDTEPAGFEWIDCNDWEQSALSCLRRSGDHPPVVTVFNFTPVVRHNYQIGVPSAGFWKEMLNSDGAEYGGSGQGNLGGIEASPVGVHGRPFSLNMTLPPLSAVFLRPELPHERSARVGADE